MATKGLDIEDTPTATDPIPLVGAIGTASGIVVVRCGLVVRIPGLSRPRPNARAKILVTATAIF